MTLKKKPWYRKPGMATLFHASLLGHLLTAVVWNLTNPKRTRRGMKTAVIASAMSVWEIGSVISNFRVWRRHRLNIVSRTADLNADTARSPRQREPVKMRQ
jgi:hypothetical protein